MFKFTLPLPKFLNILLARKCDPTIEEQAKRFGHAYRSFWWGSIEMTAVPKSSPPLKREDDVARSGPPPAA